MSRQVPETDEQVVRIIIEIAKEFADAGFPPDAALRAATKLVAQGARRIK
jgi:hypothetical protein